MAFVQIVEFETDKAEEVRRLGEKYQADTEGKRTSKRVTVAIDRDNPRRFMIIAEFDTYEAAMENSNLAETDALAAEMRALVDAPPTFHDLEVVDCYDS